MICRSVPPIFCVLWYGEVVGMAQCCPGDDLVLLAALISMAIARGMGTEDLNILSDLYNAIGCNLAIIAAKREACEKQDDSQS